jgi:hypothetical protein
MSWRTIQLQDQTCDQDDIILDLFKDQSVNYIGIDDEFAEKLMLASDSDKLIAIFNGKEQWLSELIEFVEQQLKNTQYQTFYFGINRYLILGNDTNLSFNQIDSSGEQIINLITDIFEQYGCFVTQSGKFDDDRGRYFNFVQPLTWVYGHRYDRICTQ